MKIPFPVLAILLPLTASLAVADLAPPFSGVSPPPAPAHPAATAQERIAATQRALTQAQAALGKVTGSDPGGHRGRAQTAITQALSDAAAALAFLQAHPEANPLPNGPAPAESAAAHPIALPRGEHVPDINLLTALEGLNVALNQLLNNPASDYHGPVLGALNGFREKIVADIGTGSAAVFAAIRAAGAAEDARRNAAGEAAQAAEEAEENAPRSPPAAAQPPAPAAGAPAAAPATPPAR